MKDVATMYDGLMKESIALFGNILGEEVNETTYIDPCLLKDNMEESVVNYSVMTEPANSEVLEGIRESLYTKLVKDSTLCLGLDTRGNPVWDMVKLLEFLRKCSELNRKLMVLV